METTTDRNERLIAFYEAQIALRHLRQRRSNGYHVPGGVLREATVRFNRAERALRQVGAPDVPDTPFVEPESDPSEDVLLLPRGF